MACARLLEPRTAEPGDAPYPRTTAAPSEASQPHSFCLRDSPAPPQLPPKRFTAAERLLTRLAGSMEFQSVIQYMKNMNWSYQ